jgi:hypothetical protein
MIIRRLTKHVKEQNWFAVILDFIIVVVGILIAFQITDWSETRKQEFETKRALSAIEVDLVYLLWISSEQMAGEPCRVQQITNIRDALIRERAADELFSLPPLREPDTESDGVSVALPQVFRMPRRSWRVESWQAALATGVAANFSPEQFGLLSAIFANAAENVTLQAEQAKMIGEFGDLLIPAVMTPQERRRVLSTLSKYDALSTEIAFGANGTRGGIMRYTFTSPDRFVYLPADRAALRATPDTVPAIYKDCANFAEFQPVWEQFDLRDGSK